MKATAAIAVNVFRESVRDKVLYNLVLFAVLLIGASYLLGQLTAGQDVKIIKDLGLAATSIFGLFIAVFIGIGLVSKEVERRSIYSLLAKPIHRYQLIARQVRRAVLTLAVNVAVMTVALLRRARRTWRGASARRAERVGGAGARSGAAQGDGPDLRRAAARHGHRAVLLDLLDPDPVGRADLRALRRRPLQRRPAELRPGGRVAGGGAAGARALLGAAEPRASSTSRRRSSTGSRCRSATWR